MPDKLIGHVTHYFPKVSVAVIKLTDGGLAVGDTVKIAAKNEFTQIVQSMQVDHAPVESGKVGDEVAIKVDQPADEKDQVFAVMA